MEEKFEEKLETQTEATNEKGKEQKMEEKNTYQKPDFANEEKFASLTAVSEKSYSKIDILADVAKLCKSEGVNEDFGKMLIDYYKFALDARQACPDRPCRAAIATSGEYLLIAKLAITRRVSEAIARIFFQTHDRFSIFFDA